MIIYIFSCLISTLTIMSEAPAYPHTNEPNGNNGNALIDISKDKPEKKDKKKKSKEPKEDRPGTFSYAFKQQILKAWQPVPSFGATLVIFIASGIFFLALGIAMLLLTKKIWTTTVQYDNQCTTIGAECTISVYIDEDVEGPVFLYYEINNMYQNYRRFSFSKSIEQFKGEIQDYDDASEYCNNAITNAEMGVTKSWGGATLNPDAVAHPCGLFPRALFNDSYALYNSAGTKVDISESGIAWDTDKNNVYKAPKSAGSIQWTDTTNEHFMVWMRAAFHADFIKLWGRIEGGLSKGTYTMKIQNKYDVAPFGGAKKIFLSTANAFGGSNSFLSIAYIVVGGVSFFFALLSIFNKGCVKSKFKEVMRDD